MPAYFDSGYTVRVPAWHRLGLVLDEYPGSWGKAREYAGMLWEPTMVPAYGFAGIDVETNEPVYAPGEGVVGDYIVDKGFSRVVRSDTGATLAHASDTYTLITHGDMGMVVEAILENPNARYETAGVLEGGKAVWALVRLDEPITIDGDTSQTLPYLAILNRHDGTGSCKVISTAVRVVCANTFKAAELAGEQDGTVYAFRHHQGWKQRLEEAKDAIRGVKQAFSEYMEIAESLATVRVSPSQTEGWIGEMFPIDVVTSDRKIQNIETARQAVRDILRSPTTRDVAHTAYGLVQAAGEYYDHVRRAHTPETRFTRTMVRPEPYKQRAMRLALAAANS